MTTTFLEKLVGLAAEIADAQGASLFLVDGNLLRPYIVYNLPEEYIAGIGLVRIGTQCCGRAVEAKRPWIVADMLEDPLFAEGRDGAANSPIRAAFSVPVFDGDTVIASLACHFTAPHTPSMLDVERNEHFARLIAITIKGRGGIERSREPVFVWPRTPVVAPAASSP
jgi:GAF domain-containing protein